MDCIALNIKHWRTFFNFLHSENSKERQMSRNFQVFKFLYKEWTKKLKSLRSILKEDIEMKNKEYCLIFCIIRINH